MPSQSREFRKRQDRQASWERLRTAPWSPLSFSRASGSGIPRIQLVHLPSFSTPAFWEVCQRDSDWLLYSSTVVEPDWSALMVQGYELKSFDSQKLKEYFARLTGLNLPIGPDRTGKLGLDGTTTQLTLFGDLFSSVRFQWWSKSPPEWAPLVEIADEMMTFFGSPESSK